MNKINCSQKECLYFRICESYQGNICGGCLERHAEYIMQTDGKCKFYDPSRNLTPNQQANELPPHDNINHPSHYIGKIECIDALESATQDLHGIEAICTANAIKYLWRWKRKNGAEDLKKAQWYINRLLQGLEGKQCQDT